ncbi:hypothetical protein P5G50_04090 [Leifsonia sp. F6_8S_P_1B]|uniref:Uncharacterized protein n=1 Tax=Leifsonia williamsii TaxID=3035919 RepID=A0ABT8K9B2_9MICO|nr:hypothetical protein [Leifsonia williamsii]MDN4613627.1 hypothetical protein [Leifsonia williamsii]
MKFVTPLQKGIVVAVLVVVSGLLALLLDALHSETGSIVLSVLQVAGWYLASRLFRGPEEPLRPARAWWRMTSRPLLSGVLGALYVVTALVNVVYSILGYGSLSGWVSILAEAVLGGLFVLSFLRLRSLGRLSTGAASGELSTTRPNGLRSEVGAP